MNPKNATEAILVKKVKEKSVKKKIKFDESKKVSFYSLMDKYERKVIQWALDNSNNVAEAAKLLNLQRPTLCMKMKRLGLGKSVPLSIPASGATGTVTVTVDQVL